METTEQNRVIPKTYLLSSEEMGVFVDQHSKKINELSPYKEERKRMQEEGKKATGTDKMEQMKVEGNLEKIIQLLFEPEIGVRYHSGGNIAVEEQFFVGIKKDMEEVLAHFIKADRSVILLLFNNWTDFNKWWADIYGCDGVMDYQRIVANEEEFEVLVCLLHSLDLYRRNYIKSMLDYKRNFEPRVTMAEYVDLIKTAIGSNDTRWLLPSLIQLTPGLKGVRLELKPEHLKRMEEFELLEIKENHVVTFGKMGVGMGTEFNTTWLGSIGFQAVSVINDVEVTLSQIFMTPTNFTNHVFIIDSTEGKYQFIHETAKKDQLIDALVQWKKNIVELDGVMRSRLEQGMTNKDSKDMEANDQNELYLKVGNGDEAELNDSTDIKSGESKVDENLTTPLKPKPLPKLNKAEMNSDLQITPPKMESTVDNAEVIAENTKNIMDHAENITNSSENITDYAENIKDHEEDIIGNSHVSTDKAEVEQSSGQPNVLTPKFCKNCGNPLKAEAKFCNKCGTKIGI